MRYPRKLFKISQNQLILISISKLARENLLFIDGRTPINLSLLQYRTGIGLTF